MVTINNFLGRRVHCVACAMLRNGVKTRIALEHTCGLERGAILDFETEKPESAYRNPLILGGDLKKPKPKPKY